MMKSPFKSAATGGRQCRGHGGIAIAMTLAVAFSMTSASQASIFGTLSNFDTYNTTPSDSDGAELELEGVHSSDVSSHYPSHYLNPVQYVEYDDGVHFGTRVIFDDYSFNGNAVLAPAVNPQSTNGHTCVNLSGCEHFGFSVTAQPTAVRFYWHDAAGNRLNAEPMLIGSPVWNFIPPVNPGDPPIIEAVVKVPEVEDPVEKADSIWMLVTVTESDRVASLDDLLSGGAFAGELEVETEWELLEGGLNGDIEAVHEFEPAEASKSVIRRYEYYQYTGLYSAEHEPLSSWDGTGDPPVDELGDFIAANMVAANLVPEPAAIIGALLGVSMIGICVRRRRS
jgi:hypothetical protein